MKDSLKNFIDSNRGAFDHREPSEKVWSKIETQLPKPISSWWQSVTIWRAAAILFMGLSGYLFVSGIYFENRESKTQKSEVAQLQGEFSDLESFYSEQIEQKVELINQIEDFSDKDEFSQDLAKLDAMYQVLREQMKTNPSEKVKDALILNMLVRIDMLNQQIHKLEQSKTGKEEKQDISI
jgi:hypothetical protein